MPSTSQFGRLQQITAEEVRSALESIISSDAFAGSKRCQDFLRFVVERTLSGDLESIHERQIGVEMFGRAADYDTSNDAVVRVRATEVRRRLAQYYRDLTSHPKFRIELSPGSYVPEFIEETPPAPITAPPPTSASRNWTFRRGTPAAIGVVALLVIVCFLLLVSLRYSPRRTDVVRLSLGLPQGVTLNRHWHPFEHFAISPDGEVLAFAATDASGQSSLWIRPLSSSEATKLDQTEGALLPFWSPDSKYLGFWADSKLKKVPRSGGPADVICSVPEVAQGTWGPDGTVLYARAVNSPIYRVKAAGGVATPVTKLAPGQLSQMWVQFLPDGKHFIYLARTSLTSSDPGARVYAQSLEGGAPVEILASQSRAIAVPDYLLYVRDRNLLAQQMDWNSLKLVGEPLMVARNVAASPEYLGTVPFTASQNGVLVYGTAEGNPLDEFKWYSRDGNIVATVEPAIDFQQFTLSPNGRYLALNSFHQHATGSLWLIDLASQTTTPLTTDPHAQSDPVWSSDSRFVAFNLLPNGGTDPPFLVQKIEIGTQTPQPIYGDDQRHWVEDWTPDGHYLLTHDTKAFSLVDVLGEDKPQQLFSSAFLKDAFHLSPDGRLIAFGENRTGRWEVFVASFPSFQNIKQISLSGGAQPRWRADGKELFFLDLDGKMMSVSIPKSSPSSFGIPRKLFDSGLIPDPTVNQYAVTPDGMKFLILEPRKGYQESYSVVLNWPATAK